MFLFRLFRRSPKQVCPYCQKPLDKKTVRKKQCPHCKNTILVRQGKLMTDEDATIKDWLTKLQGTGIDQATFDRKRQQLSKKLRHTASVNDTLWSLLNEAIPKADHVDQIYFFMADLARSEGKNPNTYLADAAKHRLLEYKKEGVTHVNILTANDKHVCQACRKLATEPIPIDQALKKLPIPHSCKSKDGCRCGYVAAQFARR